MSKTEWHDFDGEFDWVQVYEPEEYSGKKQWKVNFYPKDTETMAAMLKAGLRSKPRTNKEGKVYFILTRPTERKFGDKNVIFNPPAIVGAVTSKFTDAEGKIVGSYDEGSPPKGMKYEGNQDTIHPFSKGAVTITLYEYGQGQKGHRLERIFISELGEPFSREDPAESEETKQEQEMNENNKPEEEKVEKKSKEKAPW